MQDGHPLILSAMKRLVIAIDGPAASGKSTTAKLLAQRLGLLPVDTGAMYRAVTLRVLELGLDPHDEARVTEVARRLNIRQEFRDGTVRTFVDGRDVSEEIRTPEVTRWVSLVSSYRGVREAMVAQQRAMAARGGVVLEGRDIGTVVLPDADLKVFMKASADERARRRLRELQEKGIPATFEEVLADIQRRDRLDSSRALSPLKKAEDAIEIDTTHLTIHEQVERILEELRRRGLDP